VLSGLLELVVGVSTVMEVLLIGKLDVSLVTKHEKKGVLQKACLYDVHNHVVCTSWSAGANHNPILCMETDFDKRVI